MNSKPARTGRKRGRPPLPVAVHLARGTWRKDRHGPLPAGLQRPKARILRPTVLTRAAHPAGPMTLTGDGPLIAAIRADFEADDIVARVLLQGAACAHDRRRTLAALLDGDADTAGLLSQLAAGTAGLTAKAVEVLLAAESRAADAVFEAFDWLQLDRDQQIPHAEAS